ncbi:squalene--hopene cyclase [Paralimibaculum aggregatum]|uniref:Squalene--hopene cyclase n=1 Tax=Paralimibaculum aggregatum TaxID=3036245 RepID=A0ABQ6LI08_9RHOB|nr:squalene--hopene cyclase [Limibaculum sp. NKW23]GMG81277.1 squalene--hopene cyclase [Limibaculum sp. NKW23]
MKDQSLSGAATEPDWETAARPDRGRLRRLIEERTDKLWGLQKPDGHIVFELEADCTIPAEYVLLRHFLGEIDAPREARLARYMRRIQNPDGSWPLFHEGAGNISATVKGYWALKLIGDDPEAPHMARARSWLLGQGGAARANVFTRIMMALFRHIPWKGMPCMPVEAMLLPRWFPFHMSKIAYWSRTVLTPLLILYARRARAVNPTGLGIEELFLRPPAEEPQWQVNPAGSRLGDVFLVLDRVLHKVEPLAPRWPRERAVKAAEEFMLAHLNGDDGLGAIYPAMANAVMALRVLGYADDHPAMRTARDAVEKLVVERGEGDEAETYLQPCLSPVWDTCLAAQAFLEAGCRDDARLTHALDWLADKQILEHVGDWAVRRPGVRPGGWAFQYENPDYPDVDDTAVVAMAMHRADPERYAMNVDRACEWIAGMQSSSGGWGAFDPENEHYYLNAIPFADHGALLDPPTVDVTARCVGCLAQVDRARFAGEIARGIAFIKREQEADGSWFGRWGANYIYGTWSALVALNGAGEDMDQPYIRRAVDWLKARQRADGGWGEGLETYEPWGAGHAVASTPSQTAWALLALISAGEVESREVVKGVRWLETAPREADGPRWKEAHWTGTGFPRVFYLKYHGYAAFFPLWAMARYEQVSAANDRKVRWGI